MVIGSAAADFPADNSGRADSNSSRQPSRLRQRPRGELNRIGRLAENWVAAGRSRRGIDGLHGIRSFSLGLAAQDRRFHRRGFVGQRVGPLPAADRAGPRGRVDRRRLPTSWRTDCGTSSCRGAAFPVLPAQSPAAGRHERQTDSQRPWSARYAHLILRPATEAAAANQRAAIRM